MSANKVKNILILKKKGEKIDFLDEGFESLMMTIEDNNNSLCGETIETPAPKTPSGNKEEEKIITTKTGVKALINMITSEIDGDSIDKLIDAFICIERSKSKRCKSETPKRSSEENNGDDPEVKKILTQLKDIITHTQAALQEPKIELPAYNTENPGYWFNLVEQIFDEFNVQSDKSKLNYVISKFDMKTIASIENEIRNPCAEEKYERVKNLVLGNFHVQKRSSVNN